MQKVFVALGLMLTIFVGTASAQTTCGTFPNNLTNGTTADATQVMGNFNYVLNCVNALRGYLGGMTLSNDGTSPNTVIDTSLGDAVSDDATTMMTITTSSWTKNANASWASGTANGCLDTGSSLAASQWYHLFVIANASGTVDELCSTSATSPTLPTGYTKKRRIGSFKTDSSAHILKFSQNGDEFIWGIAVGDVNTTTLGTTATLFALSTPPGAKTNALIRIAGIFATSLWHELINSPDETASIFVGNYNLFNVAGSWCIAQLSVRTNTSNQIQAIADNANSQLIIATYGWIDTRGRFQ